MAIPAYMTITATKQGKITDGALSQDSVGTSYKPDHENEIQIQGFNHDIVIPRDPQSGQPTGQRVHKPLKITKVFDKSSPLLLAALTAGESLQEVSIKWYRITPEGQQQHYFTTAFKEATIVSIKDYMHNCQDPANEHYTHLEDVEFTYRRIEWTHEVCGTMGSDDWGYSASAS